MKAVFILSLTISILMTSCTQVAATAKPQDISDTEESPGLLITLERTRMMETDLPVPTAEITVEETETFPPEMNVTPSLLPSATITDGNDLETILINHQSLVLFPEIPDDVIREASSFRVLVRHSSVGENIRFGLECLHGEYPQRRPNACSEFFDLRYDPEQWLFQFRGNPGWIEKVNDFVNETNAQSEDFDVFMFTLGYLDGFDGMSYPEISSDENFLSMYSRPLENLEEEYPEKIFVWWTMSLAQVGHENTKQFNENLRSLAAQNNRIVFDIADIESHDPDGEPCVDGNQIPVICSQYTDEEVAGHLNEAGREMAAKAFWVLMAELTGWRK